MLRFRDKSKWVWEWLSGQEQRPVKEDKLKTSAEGREAIVCTR